jgi:hypothetical protein
VINRRDVVFIKISPFLNHGYNIEPIQLGDENNTNPIILADNSNKSFGKRIIHKLAVILDITKAELAAAQ